MRRLFEKFFGIRFTQAQLPGQTRDVAGASPDALPLSGVSPCVDAIFFYGQSNAGAGGTSKSVLTKPVSDTMLTFAGSCQAYGSAPLDPAKLGGKTALSDRLGYPPFPATAMAYALEQLASAKDGSAYFFFTSWFGGQPLRVFQREATAWINLVTAAERFTQIIGETRRRPRVMALVFIQGESGPSNRQTFADGLSTLLDDTLPALREATGQEEEVAALLLQTNAPAAGSKIRNDSDLAQADVAAARRDTTLAGPMYQFPLDHNIHQTAEGRMMLGELLARVYRQVVIEKRPFEPLHPTGATREGRSIVLRFHRPEGSGPLRWDMDWVQPSPHYGFAVEGGQQPLPIASVAIIDADQVRIELADEPPAGRLRVAYAQAQPIMMGWASGRGQLVADTAIPSAFHAMGYHVPERLSDYCIRFALDVE
jgi:hypothetical protein